MSVWAGGEAIGYVVRRRAQPAAGAVSRCGSESTRRAGRTGAGSAASPATRSAGWSSSTARPSTSSSSTSRAPPGAMLPPGGRERRVRLRAAPGRGSRGRVEPFARRPAPPDARRSAATGSTRSSSRRSTPTSPCSARRRWSACTTRSSSRCRSLTVPSRRERVCRAAQAPASPCGARRRLFTVSEASRAAIAQHFGIAADRLRVVPGGAGSRVRATHRRRRSQPACAEAGLGRRATATSSTRAGSARTRTSRPDRRLRPARADGRAPTLPLLVLVGDLESETYLSSAASVRERIARHGLGRCGSPARLRLRRGARVPLQRRDRRRDPVARRGLRPAGGRGCSLRRSRRAQRPRRHIARPSARPRSSSRRQTSRRSRRSSAAWPTDETLRRDVAARAREAVSGLTWDAAAAELRALIHEAARLR